MAEHHMHAEPGTTEPLVLAEGLRETCRVCYPAGPPPSPFAPTAAAVATAVAGALSLEQTTALRTKDFTLDDEAADAQDVSRSQPSDGGKALEVALQQAARMAKDAEDALAAERAAHGETRGTLEQVLAELEAAKAVVPVFEDVVAAVRGAKSLKDAMAAVAGHFEAT